VHHLHRSCPRRRSSQQRVSLIAGRVSIAQDEPPSPPPAPTRLVRSNSAASFLSVASVGAPTPNSEPNVFLTERSISEFVIEGEIGRGAYGLVKRAKEMQADGTCGVSMFSQKKNFQWLNFKPARPILASCNHQTSDQVSYPCGLLEAASQVWNDTHRNLRNVVHLFDFVFTPNSPAMGPHSTYGAWSQKPPRLLGGGLTGQGPPQYLPVARLF
jgi:serine/threonine protein kinase